MKMNRALVVLLTLTVGLVMVFITGCGDSRTRKARIRVDTILKGITQKDGKIIGDSETAVCMWYANKYRLDGRALDIASNKFDQWMNQGDLPSRLDSYTITNAQEVGHSIVVSGTINGDEFKMRVPDEKPITWLQTPQESYDEEDDEDY